MPKRYNAGGCKCCNPGCVLLNDAFGGADRDLSDSLWTKVAGDIDVISGKASCSTSNSLYVTNVSCPHSNMVVEMYCDSCPIGDEVRLIFGYTDVDNYGYVKLVRGSFAWTAEVWERIAGGPDAKLIDSFTLAFGGLFFPDVWVCVINGYVCIDQGGSYYRVKTNVTGTKAGIGTGTLTGTATWTWFQFRQHIIDEPSCWCCFCDRCTNCAEGTPPLQYEVDMLGWASGAGDKCGTYGDTWCADGYFDGSIQWLGLDGTYVVTCTGINVDLGGGFITDRQCEWLFRMPTVLYYGVYYSQIICYTGMGVPPGDLYLRLVQETPGVYTLRATLALYTVIMSIPFFAEKDVFVWEKTYVAKPNCWDLADEVLTLASQTAYYYTDVTFLHLTGSDSSTICDPPSTITVSAAA
jgi:hypothetical protein